MRTCSVLLSLALIAFSAAAEPLPMALKAAVFTHDMDARFMLDGQALCKRRVPPPGEEATFNMPDNAYMTGIYLGTLAMKYAVTGDEETRDAVAACIGALHLLCNVSGRPGLLARAF